MPDYKGASVGKAKRMPKGSYVSVKGIARGITEVKNETLEFYLQDGQDVLHSVLRYQPQHVRDSDYWYFKLREIWCTLRSSSESGIPVILNGQIKREEDEYRYTIYPVARLVVERISFQDALYEV